MTIEASSEMKWFDRQTGFATDASSFSFSQAISPWASHARQWHAIGSPLRPCVEDVRLMATVCSARSVNILLLGVTPEIAGFPWPEGTHLTAVDLHLPMIRHVWPGDSTTRNAVCADWLSLPFADHQFDLVIGDGCLTLLNFPGQYGQLSASIRRVLKPGGVWVMRQFCRPKKAETIEDVGESLWSGGIGSVHALKWRIAMALHEDRCAPGIVLDDIWRAYRSMVSDPDRLTDSFGWPAHEVATLNNYRGSRTCYTFPVIDEIARAMPEFHVQVVGHGAYELADRCPILSLTPLAKS
jgi:Methylase involved in ubiquinone/menaquinone biosynthesis